MLSRALRESSLATLAGLAVHYALYYAFGWPLLTDQIAEWIMAHTPHRAALAFMQYLGEWAKPWANTGGLAALGFCLFVAWFARRSAFAAPLAAALAAVLAAGVSYPLFAAHLGFSVPAAAALWFLLKRGTAPVGSAETSASVGRALSSETAIPAAPAAPARPAAFAEPVTPLTSAAPAGRSPFAAPATPDPSTEPAIPSAPAAPATSSDAAKTGLERRRLIQTVPLLLSAGVAAVAVESWQRERLFAARATAPRDLFPFHPPSGDAAFAPDLVRPLVTPAGKLYRMSKNPVDPVIDPREWRLEITIDGRPWRRFSYVELLAFPRAEEWVTLRCVSNGIASTLMGNALWSGIGLAQIVDRSRLPGGIVEAAFLGADGHDDSVPLDYAFGSELRLVLGMNGRTLSRVHGFPARVLAPRYYGFKSVKWLREIRFVSRPYYGYWPRVQNFTKEPVIHTMSAIDGIRGEGNRVIAGGIAFAGSRGIRRVQVRVPGSPWVDAELEPALSAAAWTRWRGVLPVSSATIVEARAQDGDFRWQAEVETPFFPDGVAGPTRRRFT